jgi:hypothetical protein
LLPFGGSAVTRTSTATQSKVPTLGAAAVEDFVRDGFVLARVFF